MNHPIVDESGRARLAVTLEIGVPMPDELAAYIGDPNVIVRAEIQHSA